MGLVYFEQNYHSNKLDLRTRSSGHLDTSTCKKGYSLHMHHFVNLGIGVFFPKNFVLNYTALGFFL